MELAKRAREGLRVLLPGVKGDFGDRDIFAKQKTVGRTTHPNQSDIAGCSDAKQGGELAVEMKGRKSRNPGQFWQVQLPVCMGINVGDDAGKAGLQVIIRAGCHRDRFSTELVDGLIASVCPELKRIA